MTTSSTTPTAVETPPVERQIAFDLVRRAALIAPVLLIGAGLARGADGAASAAYGLAIVAVNFLLSAALLGRAARMSPAATMAAVLGGFVVRMALVVGALYAVDGASWVDNVVLGLTVVVTHLGLLVWETRVLSISFAYPTFKPKGVK